jgi:hypothetical protein
MLMRDSNEPPKTPFTSVSSGLVSASYGAMACPAMIVLCSAPGWSTRMTRAAGSAASPTGCNPESAAAFQLPNAFSTDALASSSEISPIMKTVMLSGANSRA